MEIIKNYDRNEGELIMDESQEEVWADVEEAKAWHTIGQYMVWIQIALFYGQDYYGEQTEEEYQKNYSDAKRDFDAFVINELGFKWLSHNEDGCPLDYEVYKIFSRKEAEVIKARIIAKSLELEVEVYAHESRFNQSCRCGLLTEMQYRFHNDNCGGCGRKLPDKEPWSIPEPIIFTNWDLTIPEKIKKWVHSLI